MVSKDAPEPKATEAEVPPHVDVPSSENPDMPNTDRPAGTPGGPADPSLNYSPSAEAVEPQA